MAHTGDKLNLSSCADSSTDMGERSDMIFTE